MAVNINKPLPSSINRTKIADFPITEKRQGRTGKMIFYFHIFRKTPKFVNGHAEWMKDGG